MMPISSHTVAARIQDWFSENSKSRNEGIANRIKDSIQSNEVGILLISDGHQVHGISKCRCCLLAINGHFAWQRKMSALPPIAGIFEIVEKSLLLTLCGYR